MAKASAKDRKLAAIVKIEKMSNAALGAKVKAVLAKRKADLTK